MLEKKPTLAILIVAIEVNANLVTSTTLLSELKEKTSRVQHSLFQNSINQMKSETSGLKFSEKEY
jgi:hypothetical protein